MPVAAAGVSAYWGSLFAGRVALGFAPAHWRADPVLAPAIAGCGLAALGLAFDAGDPGNVAAAAVLAYSDWPARRSSRR